MNFKLIILLISAIVLFSCKNEQNAKQIESKVEQKVEKETKEEPIDKSEQEVIIAVSDTATVELKADIYYPLEGEVKTGGKKNGQLSLNIHVKEDLEVISDNITNEMGSNGWTNAGNHSVGNTQTIIFKKPGRKVSYVVSLVRSNQCNVSINVFDGI